MGRWLDWLDDSASGLLFGALTLGTPVALALAVLLRTDWVLL
jgi:hypothetical protein